MHRHPLRGLFGGFLLGLGISLALVQLSAAPLGQLTVVTVIGLCTVLGVVVSYALPARRDV